MHMDDAATAFCELFPALYLRFRRRGARGERWTPQTDAVLRHLTLSGPLTVGEMARHLGRAQSVVSEIVDGLVRKGLLERLRDARDRRRVLVWLTDAAREALARRDEVLDRERVADAMRALPIARRRELVASLRALVDAPSPSPSTDRRPGRSPEETP